MSRISFFLLFTLGCVTPERQDSAASELLVKSDIALDRLKGHEEVLRAVPSDKKGQYLVTLKGEAGDSLPEILGKEGGSVNYQRLNSGEDGSSSSISEKRTSSSLDFPDIFDIFTRIY